MMRDSYYNDEEMDVPAGFIDHIMRINELFSRMMVKRKEDVIVPQALVGEITIDGQHIWIMPSSIHNQYDNTDRRAIDGDQELFILSHSVVDPFDRTTWDSFLSFIEGH